MSGSEKQIINNEQKMMDWNGTLIATVGVSWRCRKSGLKILPFLFTFAW
jgi:hypothetical protein